MEYTPGYRTNGRSWSKMNAGSKPVDGLTNSTLYKPSPICSPYKVQNEDQFDMNHSYETSNPYTLYNYSANSGDSSLSYTPWSTDEVKQAVPTQLKTKIPAEKSEYGSEADLYGLVSNIVDEPDKAQSYFGEGICSSMLKPGWPLHMNRLSGPQDCLSDIKQSEDLAVLQQNYYDTDSVCSSETRKMEKLCHELTDTEQEEPWMHVYQTDTTGSYHVNPKMNFQDYSFHKTFNVPSALSEASRDSYPKRDSWISPLNKHNFETDLVNFDMINHSKTKQHKCSNFQDFSCTNGPSDSLHFDAETYAKLLQAKQSFQKPDHFTPDLNYSAAKATHQMTDRPFQKNSTFVSEYDDKTDYGMKALCGGNSSFLNHLQKVNQMQHDLQNSDYLKSPSLKTPLTNVNSNRASWLNGNNESNYCHQLRLNSVLSNAQKSYNPSSPLMSTTFQKHSNENPGFSSFEYSADRPLEGFGKAREERIFEVSDKRFKPFNGVSENASNMSSPLDNTRKMIFSDKKQGVSYCADEKTFEDIAKSYKEMYDNALNYNSQGSGDGKTLAESKLTFPQNTFFSNGLMDEMRNNKTNTIQPSINFRSQFSHNLDHTSHPIVDNYDAYRFKDLCQVCPRFNDLLQGNASSIHGLPSAFNVQRPSITAGEFHMHLEECYDQCRALEKDRKRTESILVKHYPGKKVSSTNNTPIPRLTANPSRVDRLIVDQLREQARVATLLGKMERCRSSPLHANISTALDRYLESIHNVQSRRKDEIANSSNRQKHGKPRHHDDRDVFTLASSIKDMTIATRKARTALWCALQMTLPKMSPGPSSGDLDHVLQASGKAQG